MQQREAMAVPRGDLETGDGGKGRKGRQGRGSIGVNNRGSWRNANAAKTEGMNRRGNWRGRREKGEEEKQRGGGEEASKRKEKDSRVVLLLDEIEFLFDPLASVSHREFQPSRSPAASSATLQQKERGEGEKKGEK